MAWSNLVQGDEILKAKIFKVAFEPGAQIKPAGSIEITRNELKVAVSDGIVKILELQLPGKKRMKVQDLLNGYSFEEKAKFV